MSLTAIIRAAPAAPCRPWPRHVLTRADWLALATALDGEPADLLALWADTIQVHALLAAPDAVLLASTPVVEGGYPALSPHRPAAAWFERMVRDLWGHVAVGGADLRPWLDHGAWEHAHPMAARPPAGHGGAQVFIEAAAGLHQIPLGPIHGGIAEPGHFRIHAAGEAVARVETRLGYAHKGTLLLMRGKLPRAAARFAARLSGDATVAHAVAFARAAEAASGIEAPPRAHALRAVMAELERTANHLGDLAGLCDAAGFAWPDLGRHREALLRASGAAFGHRLMMDCVTPGGVATDLAADGHATVALAVTALAAALPDLAAVYDRRLAPRFAGLGTLSPQEAQAFAAPGPSGRSAGRVADARRWPGYPPYALSPAGPASGAGDVAARGSARFHEMRDSATLLAGLLESLPPGPLTEALPAASGEGVGVAESVRGDVWHWLRLDGGLIASAFAADPGWRIWPLVELAAARASVADFPVILQSFAASPSGTDL